MNVKLYLGFVILALALSIPAGAADPTWLGPTGLFGVLSSDTLGKGEFSGSLYYNNFDRQVDIEGGDYFSYDINTVSMPLAYGITDRLEVSLVPSYVHIRSSFMDMNLPENDGFGDILVSLKGSFLSSDGPMGLGGLVYAKIPAADEEEELGTGEADYGLAVLASKRLNRFGVHLNLGYRFVGDPDQRDYDDQITYGAGLDFGVTDSLALLVELTGETAADPMMVEPLDLTSGLRMSFSNGLAVGGGLRYSFNMDEDICPVGGVFHIGYSFGKSRSERKKPELPPPIPSSMSCIIAASRVIQGQSMEITTRLDGTFAEPVTYQWAASGCRLEPDGAFAVLYTDECAAGRYTVTCTARSADGETVSCAVDITVDPVPVPVPPPTFLETVLFKKGTRVDNIAKARLDDLALIIKQHPGATILLVGHTDDTGSEEQNVETGRIRAENVRKYLVERHGIEPGRFKVESRGETEPVSDNSTPEDRAKNRRVEIVVSLN